MCRTASAVAADRPRRPAASSSTAILAGKILARDAKTGEVLWQFQTGFGAEATPMVYEVDGEQSITN